MKQHITLTKKLVGLTLLILIIFNIFSALILSAQSKRIMKEQIDNQFINSLNGIAANIDGDKLETLIETKDVTHEYYQEIHTYLERVESNCNFEYLYTGGAFEDGNFYYLVDSLSKDDEDFSNLGDLFEEAEEANPYQDEKEALKTGNCISAIEYYDEYGYLLTGYVAIYNSQNEPVALLAADMLADDYIASLHKIQYTLFAILLLSTFLMAFLLGERIS